MPTYRSTIHIAAGQLSDEDDNKLRTAVATGANFQDIKDIMFGDRFDLSPQILENRARELGAEWSLAENVALLKSLELPLKMDDQRYLDRLQAKIQEQRMISPLRSIEEINARVNNLMDIGEDYNLRNPPAEASSQGQQRNMYGTDPYIPAYSMANPEYQTPEPSSSHTTIVSQSIAGLSSWSAQDYDVLWAAAEPSPRYDSDWQRHDPGHGIHITTRDFEYIKGKIAEGLSFQEIAEKSNPRCTADALRQAFKRKGGEHWSQEQDNHLLELQREHGNDWAELRRKLSGQGRDEDEIEKRLNFLIPLQNNNHEGSKCKHEYTKKDDDYIREQRAQDKPYGQMIREWFPDVSPSNLQKHAKKIGATWSEEDNQKLRDLVLQYRYVDDDDLIDWEFIGQQWCPFRCGFAVKTRWKRLRGRL